MTSTLDIFRLYYNQSMFEIPQIDMKLDWGGIFNELGQYCPHLAWNRGALGINMTYRQEFMNCSKVLVKNLWDIEGVYAGKYAKYIDECTRSQAGASDSDDPQVTATFWEKDFINSTSEYVLMGTLDPASKSNCYNLPLVSTASASFSQDNMIEAAGNLAWHNLYKKAFNAIHDLTMTKVKLGNSYSFFD